MGALIKAQGRQVLAACLAEGLAALGCINGGKPHGHLLVSAWLAASGFDGVAIGDADNKTQQSGGNHNDIF